MNALLRQINSMGWGRIFAIFLSLWAVILFVTVFQSFNTNSVPISDSKTEERLNAALGDLEALKKQNLELQEILKGVTST